MRYRYYVSKSTHHDRAEGGIRIPAREIEGLVTARVAALFDDPFSLAQAAGFALDAASLPGFMQRVRELSATLRGSRGSEITALVQQVRVEAGVVAIDVDPAQIAELTGAPSPPDDAAPLTLTEPMRLSRTGRVMRLVDNLGQALTQTPPDASLIAMIITARRWWAQLAEGTLNIKDLAQREGVTASWMTRTLRLAFLSPALVEQALDGTLNPNVSAGALIQPGAIPADWQEQMTRYG